MTQDLTHFDAAGQAHMVDVSAKAETHRRAIAQGKITMQAATFAKVVGFGVGLSVFNMVLGTLLAGIWALVYNVIARFTGGLSVGFTNN